MTGSRLVTPLPYQSEALPVASLWLKCAPMGTHTGPLDAPGGTIPATGKRVVVLASFWITFEGEQVKEAHHHLDVMSLLQQLGVISTPGPGGE